VRRSLALAEHESAGVPYIEKIDIAHGTIRCAISTYWKNWSGFDLADIPGMNAQAGQPIVITQESIN
jgi:hypothetical protein